MFQKISKALLYTSLIGLLVLFVVSPWHLNFLTKILLSLFIFLLLVLFYLFGLILLGFALLLSLITFFLQQLLQLFF